MKATKDLFWLVLWAMIGLLTLAGVVIPLVSDRYSAKQAIVAGAMPPYAIYIAVTHLLSAHAEKESAEENWEHLSRAIDSCNAANAIIQAGVPGPAPQEDIDRFKHHWRQALGEARLIDCDQLERSESNLGGAVRMYLVPGLELLVEGSTSEDAIRGQALLRQFGEIFGDFYDKSSLRAGEE